MTLHFPCLIWTGMSFQCTLKEHAIECLLLQRLASNLLYVDQVSQICLDATSVECRQCLIETVLASYSDFVYTLNKVNIIVLRIHKMRL